MKQVLLGYCLSRRIFLKTHRPESIGIFLVGRRLKIFLTTDPRAENRHAGDVPAETRSVTSVAEPTVPPDDQIDFHFNG